MNWKTHLMNRLVAAVCVCGLVPAPAWSDTAKTRPAHAYRVRAVDHRHAPEVSVDSASGHVTVRVSPRDRHELRVPFSPRERLTVFENGVRQSGITVDVEHSPITVAVLIENGGRSHQLNESVTSDAAMFIRPLLDVLDTQDRLGVFAYGDAVRSIVDFETPRDQWSIALGRLPKPTFSETNFYDATQTVLERLAGVSGRKALLILSTGIDTFSRTSFSEVLNRAEQVKAPVYVFNLGELARRRLASASWGLLSRVNWDACQRQLARLAEASGGRAYMSAGAPDVQGIYDEIIEDLKVRYVLTYAPSVTAPSIRRTVQVAVVDSIAPEETGAAERSRRRKELRVIAEATYTPVTVAAVSEVAGQSR